MTGNCHVRCGTGEKAEIISKPYLSLFGKIPDFTKKISTIRSRNISISVIFQNIAQLENRYPQNQYMEILGNCDTQLFLGCTDAITAEFISNRTGEVTVGVSSESKQLNTYRVSDYTPEYRQTSSTGKRKLLTPDEVLRMPLDEALIILRGQKVLKVHKFDYSLHPESKKLEVCNATEHIPIWRNQPEIETTELIEPVQQAPKDKLPKRKPLVDQKQVTDKSQQKAEREQKTKPNIQEPGNLQESENRQKYIQDTENVRETEDMQETSKQVPKQITVADKNSIMS